MITLTTLNITAILSRKTTRKPYCNEEFYLISQPEMIELCRLAQLGLDYYQQEHYAKLFDQLEQVLAKHGCIFPGMVHIPNALDKFLTQHLKESTDVN